MYSIIFLGLKLAEIQFPSIYAYHTIDILGNSPYANEKYYLYNLKMKDKVFTISDTFSFFSRSFFYPHSGYSLIPYVYRGGAFSSSAMLASGDRKGWDFSIRRSIGPIDLGGSIYGYGMDNLYKGYFSIPLIGGELSGGVLTDEKFLNFSTRFLYLSTNQSNYLCALRLWDFIVGIQDNRYFGYGVLRIKDPIFLTHFYIDSDTNYYVAPIYLLTDRVAIYGVLTKNSVIGFKSPYLSMEIGKSSILSVTLPNISIIASYNDSLSWGGRIGLEKSFFKDRIHPGIILTRRGGKNSILFNLRIIGTTLFWGMDNPLLLSRSYFWGFSLSFTN